MNRKQATTPATQSEIIHHQTQRRMATQELPPAKALPVPGAGCDHWTDIPPALRPLHWEPEHDEAAHMLEHGRRLMAHLDGRKAA